MADDWVRWYRDDSARWLRLSLEARGLAAEAARKADRFGYIKASSIEDLAFMLRVDEGVVGRAWAELEKQGRIRWHEGQVFIPGHAERQERQDASDRQRRHREKLNDALEVSRAVTDVTNVTPCHKSHSLSQDSQESRAVTNVTRSDQIRSEERERPRAREEQVAIQEEQPSGVMAAALRVELTTLPERAKEIALGVQQSAGPFDVLPEWQVYVARKDGWFTEKSWREWCVRAVRMERDKRERERDRKAAAASRPSPADIGYTPPPPEWKDHKPPEGGVVAPPSDFLEALSKVGGGR